MKARSHRLAATCPRGLEAVLAEELVSLGLPPGEQLRGAVAWRGDLEQAYRALLWSRVASRVLLEIGFGKATSERVLYDTARSLDWTAHASPARTLAVDFVGANDGIRHTGYGAQRVKDAICDALRAATGARPSVDPRQPDLRVHAYLTEKHLALSVDLAGAPLHLRSGGVEGGQAPLKETLAAALLRIAGWPAAAAQGLPLVDPMCGTGTLLREGAAMARGDAPGLGRARWGFQGWLGHDPALWTRLVDQARSRPPRPVPLIVGSDQDPQALAVARAALTAQGLDEAVHLARRPLAEVGPPAGPPGILVTNPPYGERLGDPDQAGQTMAALGDVLRHRFLGWRAWILAGSPALARRLGLRPTRRVEVWNGGIDCRWLEVPISARPVGAPPEQVPPPGPPRPLNPPR
ncbi:THUMP domain-containing protein [Myxococcota bacterium]|nr:THUMP domain-containing protein [Myxococcota bacterium]